jgi:uracil-DNA glycosylase family 4
VCTGGTSDVPVSNRPAVCQGCPANKVGVGFVTYEGPLDAALMVWGWGPSEQDVYSERPFAEVDASGERFTRWLHKAGAQRSDAVLSNVVWCWIPRRPPTHDEVLYCYQTHMKPLIEQMPNLRWISTLVGVATRLALGLDPEAPTDKWVGSVTERTLP